MSRDGFAGVAHWVNGELEGIEERNSIRDLMEAERQMSDQWYAVSDDPETGDTIWLTCYSVSDEAIS